MHRLRFELEADFGCLPLVLSLPGKSTLLNLLFGTKFQMMDSSQGRSQTTKGVWMDSGDRKRDLVIMDLEGTDSGERGEDRTTFERQTSLYALAVAEVLLINMW